MPDPSVRDNREDNQFEIVVDGEVAGFAQYRRGDGGVIDMTHTEIGGAYEGQGLGGKLARGALDLVRGEGAKVVPSCEFIKGWIEKHEDYQDLVSH
jgi:predicted GNAT family acetyltransferase